MPFFVAWSWFAGQYPKGFGMLTTAERLAELKARRDELHAEATAISELAASEKRELSDDEFARFDAIMEEDGGEIAQLQVQIDRCAKIVAGEKRIAAEKRAAREAAGFNPADPGGQAAAAVRVNHLTPKLYAFKGEKQAAAKDAYDVGMYLRALYGRYKHRPDQAAEEHIEARGWGVKATMTEGTATSGGYFVPEPMVASIIDVRNSVGVSRQTARIMPMSSETLDIPRWDSGPTVYYPGEGNTITTSDSTYSMVSLVAKKRAAATQISQELKDDALVSVVDLAMQDLGYALADKEDSEYIDGDGTSTYGNERGLTNVLGSAGVSTATNSTWATLSLAESTAWLGLLPSKYRRRGGQSIICSTNFYHQTLLRLQVAAGGATPSDIATGGADAMFMGYPVYFTDYMPTTTAVSTVSALFGAFQDCVIIGDRSGVRAGMSTEYAFLDDVDTLKVTTRYDINVHAPGDTSVVGGYVGFSTGS